MTGGRQRKGKEVAGNTSFVPPPTYESFGLESSALPSPTSQIPSSRASGSPSHVPDTAVSPGSDLQKIFIRPRTHAKFDKQLLCTQKIGDLIEMRFEGAWKSWKKFPKHTRDLIFSEFEKCFEWDPTQTSQIRSIFDTCATNSIKNRMYHIRQTGKKPGWLGQAIYDELQQIFVADAFREEPERNKNNRASDCDGQGFALHMGGCVSHSEHIDRMTSKQGRAPTIAEAFIHLRSKVDSEGNVKWVNDRAKRTHEEFTTKLSQASSQSSNGDDILSNDEQIKIFSDVVGGPRKGVIYELAGQDYHVTCGSWPAIEWESERTQLQEQLNAMKSSINEMKIEFDTRVDAAVQQRVNVEVRQRVDVEVRQRVDVEVRQRVEVEIQQRLAEEKQRLDAEMDDRIEAKLMARFASFNPQPPRSPPSH